MKPETQRERVFVDQLVQSETVAANAVQLMQEKLDQRDLLIRAIVLAAGGRVEVDFHDMIFAEDAKLTVTDCLEKNSRVFNAEKR